MHGKSSKNSKNVKRRIILSMGRIYLFIYLFFFQEGILLDKIIKKIKTTQNALTVET